MILINLKQIYILDTKRSFEQNEHFLFGFNHTYDNEEMLSKNGIFFKLGNSIYWVIIWTN